MNRSVADKPSNIQPVFYDGEYYDRIFASSPRYEQQCRDIAFWRRMAERHGPAVLELACGTGRIGAVLAQTGFSVTGIDLAPPMLALARTKSARARWVEADVRCFDLAERFGLIAFPYDTFTHLHSRQDVLDCLATVRRHLAADGRFVIDLKNPAYVRGLGNEPTAPDRYATFTDPRTGQTITALRVLRWATDTRMLHRTLKYICDQGDPPPPETLRLRIYEPDELENLLRDGGFEVVETFGDYDGGAFTDASPQYLLSARSADAR